MTDLVRRSITAWFFIGTMLFGMFFSELSFQILFFLIGLGCWWEYLTLTLKNAKWRHIVGIILFTIIYWTWRHIAVYNPRMSILAVTLTVSVFLIVEMFFASEKTFRNVAYLTLGIFYISFPITLVQDISFMNPAHTFTPNLVAGLVYLVWMNDTAADMVGSKLGKNLILPLISPKKTWEGFAGGFGMCILLSFLITYVMGVLPWYHWLGLSIVVPIFGSLGDLVESLLKRSMGAKDSSTLFPGHGGFFDRYDAFIMQVPFSYLYLVIFHLN